jgi:hypothetical protein
MQGIAANTIATTEALLVDGSLVAYRDAEPQYVRQARFQAILDGLPLRFAVTLDEGSVFAVDLVNGDLTANDTIFETNPPPGCALRLVYFKRMYADTGASQAVMEFFVVGWQTTSEGRNVRMGLKVDTKRQVFEVTDAW